MEPDVAKDTVAMGGRVVRGKLSLTLQWVSATLRCSARPLITSFCFFLLPFVRWFGIPSPFAAALLLAREERPSFFSLLGIAASLALRLLWGLEADWWQYAGLLLLWGLLLTAKPKPGIEVAALGGLSMMPRAIAALTTGDPLTTLLSCAAVPLAMLFSAWLRRGLDGLTLSGGATRPRERAALLLLCLLLISALGYFRIFTLNLGILAGLCCTLAVSHELGFANGAAAGLFTGLALSFGGHDSRVAFSLSLCGFLCGLPFVARRRFLYIPIALLGNLLAFFVTPLLTPSLSYATVLLGSALFVFLPRGAREWLKASLTERPRGKETMESAFMTEHISHLQDAIKSIAKALPQGTDVILSEGAELGTLLCAQCANRELCWGRSRARTEKLMNTMMEMSQKGEVIDEEQLPALGQQGCLRAEAIPHAAQEALVAFKKRQAQQRRSQYERNLTLTHLAATMGTLNELSALATGESLNDLQAAHLIKLALGELRVPARLCYARRVDGHLQIALQAEGMLPIQKPLEALLRYLDVNEDMPLSISRAEKGHIELEEIPLYSAVIGTASVCAGQRIDSDDPDVCGDACIAQRCEGGRLLMMLCDGMGHGEAAHAQSEKTLELLLLLLQAGYTRRQAITAVNGIMLNAQEQAERFSTVDLTDVDLWTGEVCCEKLGACPTWVVRGDHIKKVDVSSLPLGILEEAKPMAVQYRLHSGDILVMMSDGVSDVFKDDQQMQKVLEDSIYIQPQRMADALLRNALLASDGTPRDDMTVMVLLLMDRKRQG
ncbi:MAG: SpoIIE family protein phosphatase [Eubacteriales bacterium]|nr:SpoIIE family protein phosphatase [Eubacteriales bacterium]